MPTLVTQLNYLEPYKPYVGFNHHYTKLGVFAQMQGDPTLDVQPKNTFLQFRQGNIPDLIPPTVSGTATSGTADRLYDTSKTFNASEYSWIWYSKIYIVSGTGAGQTRNIIERYATSVQVDVAWTTNPDATSVYSIHKVWYRNQAADENTYPALYLPHDEYTIWTMMLDSAGTPQVSRNYVNLNAYLATLPSKANSISPQIIYRKVNPDTSATVKVRAKKGDVVNIYWRYQMDDTKLGALYPGVSDGTVTISGKVFTKYRYKSFKSDPIISGQVSADNGEIEFNFSSLDINTDPAEKWIVASAQSDGFGESFSTAKLKVTTDLLGDADDYRQNKIIFTPTNNTRNISGYLEREYSINVKNIDDYDGSETNYLTLNDFYFNYFNNGDVNNIPVTDGIWLKTGATNTVLIIDQNANGGIAGTPYSYWSGYVIDTTNQTPATKTIYASLSDAVSRGPNTLLAKDTLIWSSLTWDINGIVYVNDNPLDETKAGPAGFYFEPSLNMAFQLDGSGVIIGKQYLTGGAVY